LKISNSSLLEVPVHVDLRVDGRAVEGVGHRLQVERGSHLVPVDEDGLRAGRDVAADDHLLQVHQAVLGPEDLLLEVGDALLEAPDLQLVLLLCGLRRRRRRGAGRRLRGYETRQGREKRCGEAGKSHHVHPHSPGWSRGVH
jgi:hypothetical protein